MNNLKPNLTTLQNSKDWAKRYKAKFFETGLCSYKDVDKDLEMVFLKKETIDKMLPSIIGKPVIINHNDITPENQEEHFEGVVSDAWYNVEDGWYYCYFIVFGDKGKEKIELDKYSVSCAYIPNELGKKGESHNIPYDAEILSGEFTHLALVENPRYEDAKILLNSKQKITNMFKKKNTTLNNSFIKVGNKLRSAEDVVLEFKNSISKNVLKENQKIEIDGVNYSVRQISAFLNAKCNEDKEDEKEEEEIDNEKDENNDEDEMENAMPSTSKEFEVEIVRLRKLLETARKQREEDAKKLSTDEKNIIQRIKDYEENKKKQLAKNNEKADAYDEDEMDNEDEEDDKKEKENKVKKNESKEDEEEMDNEKEEDNDSEKEELTSKNNNLENSKLKKSFFNRGLKDEFVLNTSSAQLELGKARY